METKPSDKPTIYMIDTLDLIAQAKGQGYLEKLLTTCTYHVIGEGENAIQYVKTK